MRFHNSHRPAAGCRGAAIILACLFLSGLLAGAFLCRDAWNELPFEISALASGSSLFGLLTVLLTPYLFSAMAVFLNRPVLLFPLVFWKAFFFAFVLSGLALSGGSAGWLVAGLAMFAVILSMPVLCWYWLCHIGGGSFDLREFLVGAGFLLAIGLVDFWVISPFLSNILTF